MYLHNLHLVPEVKLGLSLTKPHWAMTAFTLGIYLNFLLGRDLLAVKALFA